MKCLYSNNLPVVAKYYAARRAETKMWAGSFFWPVFMCSILQCAIAEQWIKTF